MELPAPMHCHTVLAHARLRGAGLAWCCLEYLHKRLNLLFFPHLCGWIGGLLQISRRDKGGTKEGCGSASIPDNDSEVALSLFCVDFGAYKRSL